MTNIGSIFKHSESGSLFMLFAFAGAGGPSTYVLFARSCIPEYTSQRILTARSE